MTTRKCDHSYQIEFTPQELALLPKYKLLKAARIMPRLVGSCPVTARATREEITSFILGEQRRGQFPTSHAAVMQGLRPAPRY